MPIERRLLIEESWLLKENLTKALEFVKKRDTNNAINCLTDVIISGETILKKDYFLAKILNFDKILLVAEAYQIKIYFDKLILEEKNNEQIVNEMRRIARGNLDSNNVYYSEMSRAVRNYEDGKLHKMWYSE